MTILILASHPGSLRNFRGALIESMLAKGHKLHVAAPGLGGDAATRDWLSERGVVWHDVPMARTGLNPLADLSTFLALWRLMRRLRPRLVLGYTVKPVVWGILAARLAAVPQRVALITGLGYAFTGDQRGLRAVLRGIVRALYGLALRQATLIFFQNPDDQADFARMGLLPDHVTVERVAGSGVDLRGFPVQPLPEGPIRFTLIARLLRDKGIGEYVAAAHLIRAHWPQAEFHLVGGTDPNPAAIPESEVAAWHASGAIIWHGHLADVRPVLAATHVYVLPSYREGTPRTVLEAMATGRAIITTDAPGCRQTVVAGENGFLVPVGDEQALAQAMLRFLQDPGLIASMGEASRRLAEARFDVNHVNAQMLQAMALD
jgi:glycosyltransferase involved in cell wall biosynthesis